MKINPNSIIEKKPDTFYLRDEVLKKLRDNLQTVEQYCSKRDDVRGDKYIELALKYGYQNYRVCTIADIYDLGLFKSFSYYAKEFINTSGKFLVIMNELNDKPISSVFRRLDKKDFFDFSVYYCPYGLDLFDENFKYGDPVILTEGVYDSDSLRPLFKNTLSMLTSSITVMQAEILNSITNRFIIAFDSDEAGNSGYEKAVMRLKSKNPRATVDKLDIYPGDKDLGVMEEMIWKNNEEEYKLREIYYRSKVGSILDSF